jgi:hypothetical protein
MSDSSDNEESVFPAMHTGTDDLASAANGSQIIQVAF